MAGEHYCSRRGAVGISARMAKRRGLIADMQDLEASKANIVLDTAATKATDETAMGREPSSDSTTSKRENADRTQTRADRNSPKDCEKSASARKKVRGNAQTRHSAGQKSTCTSIPASYFSRFSYGAPASNALHCTFCAAYCRLCVWVEIRCMSVLRFCAFHYRSFSYRHSRSSLRAFLSLFSSPCLICISMHSFPTCPLHHCFAPSPSHSPLYQHPPNHSYGHRPCFCLNIQPSNTTLYFPFPIWLLGIPRLRSICFATDKWLLC